MAITIPNRTAIRAPVQQTYDANRRPGSGGQRYFSDVEYVDNVEGVGNQTAANLAAQARRNEQASGLQALNLANPARGMRPPAQTLADTEVVETFTDIQNNPAYDTERKVVEQGIGAMNQYNINPYRASELMNVPINDVNAMMRPYYTAFGEAKPEGIANLLSSQKDLVAAADERLPYMTDSQGALYNGVQDLSVEDAAKLIDMGIFSPEQAAQFYQSRYPGITASEVEASMKQLGYEGYAQGGNVNGYYLGGPTDGMADQIPATIDNSQPAALSDGEFVVPADVVSHLGNGNSDAGAQNLYGMMDRVRKARTGNAEQGRQIDPNKYLA